MAREFVFVHKLWGPKKVRTHGTRSTEMTCTYPYISEECLNSKHFSKLPQFGSKMALLCKKHVRSAPCFAFSGRWWETGLKCWIFFYPHWSIGSCTVMSNWAWSSSVPIDCMRSNQSFKRNTNHRTVCTAWLRRCSQFGTPQEYITVGLVSNAQILI